MSTTFVGIDPGLDGAVAVIWPDGNVEFFDTPTVKVSAAKGNKREYDVTAMRIFLDDMVDEALDHTANVYAILVAIEKQQVMPPFRRTKEQRTKEQPQAGATEDQPKAGTVSSFRTGFGYGLWVGICAGLRMPYELIAPVSWKRTMMADMPKEKSASLLVAKRLFPQAAGELKRVKDHGRSDALLIAEFARRRSGPSTEA